MSTPPNEDTSYEVDMQQVDVELINQESVTASAGFFGFIRAHRIFTRRFTGLTGVTRGSIVCVSLTEMKRTSPSGPLDLPHMGDASMKVYNVAPENGSVFVRGEVDWDSDLDIRVSFLVS